MTLVVKHSVVTGAPADSTALVDGPAWDANHALTGTADSSQLNGNVVQAVTNDTNINGSILAQTLTLSWSGTLAAGRLNANVVQAVINDTNIQGSISAQTLTFSWAGTLAASRGGFGADVSAQSGVPLFSTGVPTFTGTTGSGNFVRATSPTLVTPALGTPASGVLTNCTAFTLTTTGTSGAATYSAGTLNIPQYAGGVTSVNGQTGALVIPVLPGGRLTLTSGTPVMVTSVSGATTVYYTAYAGSYVPIYDGTNFIPTLITGNEISLVTTDATKSPAAVAATSYYDVFVWNDSGTLRVSRGPAWTNSTTRSAGTALTLVNGIYLNSLSITNGPAASRGTYVGTIGSNGSSTIDFIYPAVSTNGTAGVFNVWNCYNRVDVAGVCGMSAVSWTYNVANTWRAQNASTTFNISLLRGLNEDGISVNLLAQSQPPSGVNCACGIGLDSTTAATGRMMYVQSSATQLLNMTAYYDGPPGLGFHTFYALEQINAATVSTFYGSGGVNYIQTGLGIRFRA